jgi:hypothetical protein
MIINAVALKQVPSCMDLGYRFISVGADVIGFWQYWAGLAAQFSRLK